MTFLYTLIGDALLFAAVAWFAGYGAPGPVSGLRLRIGAKLRLLGEVFVVNLLLLYLLIRGEGLLGWDDAAPWPGSPAPHRLVAIAALLCVGFWYVRRRARALAAARGDQAPAQDGDR